MRSAVLLFCLGLTSGLWAQDRSTYDLKWKLPASDTLFYMTVMEQEFNKEPRFNIFSKMLEVDEDADSAALTQKINDLRREMSELEHMTAVIGMKDHIFIEMTAKRSQANDDPTDSLDEGSMLDVMHSFMGNAMLRGSVYREGGVHSWWVKSSQLNLICLMFELPTEPVAIGDTWSLGTKLINNDHNFVCDSAYRVNEVTLMDITYNRGDTIAVLKYELHSYVIGDFISGLFLPGGKTMMKISFDGAGLFNISKGRWNQYEGFLNLEVEGIQSSNTSTRLALELVDEGLQD